MDWASPVGWSDRPRQGIDIMAFRFESAQRFAISMVGALVVAALMISAAVPVVPIARSEEHTSELQSLMRISYAVFCLKKKRTRGYDILIVKEHNTALKTTTLTTI